MFKNSKKNGFPNKLYLVRLSKIKYIYFEINIRYIKKLNIIVLLMLILS